MASGNIDLGSDAAERWTFLLLVAGHLLFVVALFTAGPLIGENTLYVIALLFGLPLAVLGRGDRRLAGAVVFVAGDRLRARAWVLVAGFGLVHYGAVLCATKSVHVPFTGEGFTDSPWVPGAIGGLIGAAGSF